MKRSTTLLLIGILGITFVGYLVWRFPHALNSQDNKIDLTRSLLILCLIVPSILLRHQNLSQTLKYIVGWLGIFVVLFICFSYKAEFLNLYSQVKSRLLPFSINNVNDNTISVALSDNGHFMMEVLINDTKVYCMIDTGATRTVLTKDDAKRLGIDVEHLNYNHLVETANGNIYTAYVNLPKVTVGNIVLEDIHASVSRESKGTSLLGMSFLSKFKGYKVDQDCLTLWK